MIQLSTIRLPNGLPLLWFLALAFVIPNRAGISQTVFRSKSPVTAICLIAGGHLVSGSDGGLQLHDADSLKPTKEIPTEIEKIYSIVNSPDGKRIAVAGGSPAELGVVEVFSIPGFKLIKRFEGFDDIATDVGWNSNDQLTVCSTTGDCCVFKLREQNLQMQKLTPFNVHSKSILALTVLESGEIVTAGKDNSIRVWKQRQSKKARVLNNHVDIVNDIAERPSKKEQQKAMPMVVSISDDSTARFWQPTIGRMVRFARLTSVPTVVTWRHDGAMAIVGCRDGSILSIDPSNTNQTLALPKTGEWINDLALAPDNQTLFIANQSGIRRVELKRTSQK